MNLGFLWTQVLIMVMIFISMEKAFQLDVLQLAMIKLKICIIL
jgi:hypothetical protein